MSVHLATDHIDIGIVTKDADAARRCYCDVLGFADLGERQAPGATIRRLRCGRTIVKIVAPDEAPIDSAPRGRIGTATGLSYLTISVVDLSATVAACKAADADIALPSTQLRPGVEIALIRDPDGNWIELVQSDED